MKHEMYVGNVYTSRSCSSNSLQGPIVDGYD